MSIWICTFLVVLVGVGMGWREGVIRSTFTFFGIIIATFLAAPLGHLLKPLLMHIGLPNATEAWMVAPVIVFIVIVAIFKTVGHQFHRKSEAYHKHNVSELEFSIWNRLNSRLGICLGVLNGAAYMVLMLFIIFNLGFWTTQVATADTEPFSTRMVNSLAKSAQSTGATKVAPSVGSLPADYYRLADLAGLICQNPDLTPRLSTYPMFVSLLERDDIRQITSDQAFTNDWATHAPMGTLLKEQVIQDLLKNNDLINAVWVVVQTNMDDLTNYLQTGKSPKYDSEPVLGKWDLNVRVTYAYMRLGQPSNLAPAEIAAARAYLATAYAQTTITVAADNQLYAKQWPDFKTTQQRNQPFPTLDYKGTWSQDGNTYQFTLTHDSDTKTFNVTTDGQRLLLQEGKTTYVFDRE